MLGKIEVCKGLMIGAVILALGGAVPAFAQDEAGVAVRPAVTEMSPEKNIVENLAIAKHHTTLFSAVKTASLTDTLSGIGPYTLFAPTDDAFLKLGHDPLDALMKPENAQKLKSILTYHVVPGHLTSHSLEAMADDNNGKVVLKTMQGDDLTVTKGEDDQWVLQDASGQQGHIEISDIAQKNGVVFVIDTVLMPKP